MRDAAEPDDAALDALRAWVRGRFGISFDEAQRGSFRRRVRNLYGPRDVTPRGLLARLERGDPSLTQRLVEAVVTNHTFLFREGEAFEYLRDVIAPSLPAQGPLRLWSAATSSGEEAYSMAACMSASLGRASHGRVRILGTDLSSRQIRAAERAVFASPPRDGCDAPTRACFVAAGDGAVRVREDVASLCTFRQMNLAMLPWPFEHAFDVIFLRNVLYYFDPALRARIIEACHDAARAGAWLVTSATEPTFDLSSRWRWVRPGVYRKDTR